MDPRMFLSARQARLMPHAHTLRTTFKQSRLLAVHVHALWAGRVKARAMAHVMCRTRAWMQGALCKAVVCSSHAVCRRC